MKNIIVFCLIILLFSSTLVLANNGVYDNTDDEGNIILSPYMSGIQGETIVGARVSIANKNIRVEEGQFEFDDIEPGIYTLKISKEGYHTYDKEVEIKEGQIIDIGYISLKRLSDNDSSDTLDVTDPDYIEKLNLNKDKKNNSKLFKTSSSNLSGLDVKLGYLFINYNKEVEGGGSLNSKFNSKGFLAELNYTYPFIFMDQSLFVDLNTSYITGVNGVEKVYDGDILDSTLMIDVSSKSFAGSLGYITNLDSLGEFYLSVGRDYTLLNLDVSSFDANVPEQFNKEYRFTKGWSFAGGIHSDFGKMGFGKPGSIFRNLSAGLSYKYIPTLTEITSTEEYAKMLVEGNKNIFDIYLTLNNEYQVTLGYKSMGYYTNEHIDGLITWPSFNSKFHGPYFKFAIPF